MSEATSDAVIDLSHHNARVDLAAAGAAGIAGVFHKASQGLAFVDPAYATRRSEAARAGLLWGAYHFGIDASGARQAEAFLRAARPDDATLLVLDFEQNPGGGTMRLAQAREFVARVRAATGRSPGLYSGALIKAVLGTQAPDPVLRNCFLWISEYANAPSGIPPTFRDWTFWQYTDGRRAAPVPGVGGCDRDRFNGTLQQLFDFWHGG